MILASSSKQRKLILNKIGVKYKAIPANIDENHSGFKRPHSIVKSIALRKAEKISQKYPKEWIIGCDTIVVLSNGDITIKPKNKADAKKTLSMYKNSYCDVYSGLALINKFESKEFIGYEKTRLYFKDFTDNQLKKYLDSNELQGRSGSMTIEGGGGDWIKSIKGCYWNVVGLPIDLLKKFIYLT